jgi:hypothetical protein
MDALASFSRLVPLQFRRERVLRGAAAENPSDHDPHEQDGRNEDEVRCRHVGKVHDERPPESTRRLTTCSSRSTVVSLRRIDHT